jgi:hypothetical protein
MIISILPSDKKGKKWMAKVDETGQTIYFGQAGAEDFTTHKDELKRKRWIARHKVEPWKPEVNLTPAWLSRYLLWEKDDMNKALAAASVMYPDIRFRWGSTKGPTLRRHLRHLRHLHRRHLHPRGNHPRGIRREDAVRRLHGEGDPENYRAESRKELQVAFGWIHRRITDMAQERHEATELMKYLQRKITRRQRELDALRRR